MTVKRALTSPREQSFRQKVLRFLRGRSNWSNELAARSALLSGRYSVAIILTENRRAHYGRSGNNLHEKAKFLCALLASSRIVGASSRIEMSHYWFR
jgi:hypothetical protein